MVPSGFDTACRRAGSPTILRPPSSKATYDGNALPPTVRPSAAGIISGCPVALITAHALFDVPRSIPMIFSL